MKNELIFKAGLLKKLLGWTIVLGAVSALIALAHATITRPAVQNTSEELWYLAVIAAFLLLLIAAGIKIQYVSWRIEDRTIIYGKKRYPIAELAGYCRFTFIIGPITIHWINFYDHQLKLVARLPINMKDRPKAEDWLDQHLRYVILDGSPAFPKPRFADPYEVDSEDSLDE